MKLSGEFHGMGRYMALGIQMIVVTMVVTLIGHWLDRKTGRQPVFLVVFFLAGSLAGLAVVWRALQENGNDAKRGR